MGSKALAASKQPGKSMGNRKNPFNQRRSTTNEEDQQLEYKQQPTFGPST